MNDLIVENYKTCHCVGYRITHIDSAGHCTQNEYFFEKKKKKKNQAKVILESTICVVHGYFKVDLTHIQ